MVHKLVRDSINTLGFKMTYLLDLLFVCYCESAVGEPCIIKTIQISLLTFEDRYYCVKAVHIQSYSGPNAEKDGSE